MSLTRPLSRAPAMARAAAGAARRRLVQIGLGLALAGCVAATPEDHALFQMFWVQPQDLLARPHVPAGLGLAAPPSLVMTLSEAADRPAREAAFRLEARAEAAGYGLARRDYRRFRSFQDRVVASIGPTARIAVRLDIAYCADPATPPGAGTAGGRGR